MRPATRNIALVRGDTYQHSVLFTDAAGDPVDLDGIEFAAQVRTHAESPDVLLTFTCTPAEPSTFGQLWITADSTDTAELAAGRRWWDLEQTDAALTVTTVMAGWCDVVADVTREEAAP